MTRPIQNFTTQYLQATGDATPTQIAEWLESYRLLQAASSPSKSRLISLKVPEDLLALFREKASMHGTPYQTQIKKLMLLWLKNSD